MDIEQKPKSLKDFSITEVERTIGEALGQLVNEEVRVRISSLKDTGNPTVAAFIGRSSQFDLELSLNIGSTDYTNPFTDEKSSDQ